MCTDGAVHPVHNMKVRLSPHALKNLQVLFCKENSPSVITHDSIDESGASGYYKEEMQTWIRPRLGLRVPNAEVDEVVVSGWLPNMNAYPDGIFAVQVLSDGVLAGAFEIRRAGDFSERVAFPRGARSITVLAPVRAKDGADERELSWVLGSLRFERSGARRR